MIIIIAITMLFRIPINFNKMLSGDSVHKMRKKPQESERWRELSPSQVVQLWKNVEKKMQWIWCMCVCVCMPFQNIALKIASSSRAANLFSFISRYASIPHDECTRTKFHTRLAWPWAMRHQYFDVWKRDVCTYYVNIHAVLFALLPTPDPRCTHTHTQCRNSEVQKNKSVGTWKQQVECIPFQHGIIITVVLICCVYLSSFFAFSRKCRHCHQNEWKMCSHSTNTHTHTQPEPSPRIHCRYDAPDADAHVCINVYPYLLSHVECVYASFDIAGNRFTLTVLYSDFSRVDLFVDFLRQWSRDDYYYYAIHVFHTLLLIQLSYLVISYFSFKFDSTQLLCIHIQPVCVGIRVNA